MTKITSDHLARGAHIYVRQSKADQLLHNHESRRRQYGLAERARQLGWHDVVVIDDDLGRSGSGVSRPGFAASRPRPQQETQQRPTPPREAQEASAPRPPAPEATQAELVRTEKTEPRKAESIVRAATCCITADGTDPRTTEHRRSGPRNKWLSADRSAAALPRRRSTPTCLAMTGPCRSGNVLACVRSCRRGSNPATRSPLRYVFPSTTTARWCLRRTCSCRLHQQNRRR